MNEGILFGLLLTFVVGVIVVGMGVMVARFYRKVDQGNALIVNRMRAEPDVTFTGSVVLPIIHLAEVMDISVKTIEISRHGHEGLICKDNIRADIKVSFYVRVNKTKDDVLKVAQSIGCKRASDEQTLETLFVAKFSEGLKTVGKQFDFEMLYTKREDFKDQIIEVIGRDLNGYALEDAAIDYLEQTPLSKLDPHNILDAQGIEKITRITAGQNVLTNQLTQDERKEITRQNLEADEAILELERRRADAEAKQQREILTVKAREAAETAKVQAEEHQRSELARIKAEEEVSVGELNRQRQVEVADKDRERVVAIKAEQVLRDQELEAIGRQREVERQEIDKEMELEVKRKEIADVVRSRIVVDKNVAEEEERIKDLRVHAEANRQKDVVVIAAQATAEESLVKDIKGAEASEKVAEYKAREKLVLANADLEAAERQAKAQARRAEGRQAEVAADGLAAVKVKEANAVALEKEGTAEARVFLEKAQAQAVGDEQRGLAKMVVREREIELDAKLARDQAVATAEGKEADAVATQKMGAAEADAIRLRLLAEAEGKEADARIIEVAGKAEATAIREKMAAEASGIEAKLNAMQAMEGAAREHEEFRIQLAFEEKVRLAALEAQKEIAADQADVLGQAFGQADIQIIGGDGQFLDKLVEAASLGKAIDGFMKEAPMARDVLEAVQKRIAGDTVPVTNGTNGVAKVDEKKSAPKPDAPSADAK